MKVLFPDASAFPEDFAALSKSMMIEL
jgi:hypothetical protein